MGQQICSPFQCKQKLRQQQSVPLRTFHTLPVRPSFPQTMAIWNVVGRRHNQQQDASLRQIGQEVNAFCSVHRDSEWWAIFRKHAAMTASGWDEMMEFVLVSDCFFILDQNSRINFENVSWEMLIFWIHFDSKWFCWILEICLY